MDQKVFTNPFHEGEITAQQKAGVGNVAEWAGGFIRNFLPQQHQEFYNALPFLVVASEDKSGQIWATFLEGDEGFISSPEPDKLVLDTKIDAQDPLFHSFEKQAEIGAIGIELATRRRNRLSGELQMSKSGYRIKVKQTFGNCPQYITERSYVRVPRGATKVATSRTYLSKSQIKFVSNSDTLFIGTGHHNGGDEFSSGYDASHRGGHAGFVQIINSKTLLIPDYPGNNFFNTIGNLMVDDRIGLVFVDFETGSLLQLSGHAVVDWMPDGLIDPNARRAIRVTIDAVLERPEALSLRWSKQGRSVLRLSMVGKQTESRDIASFYFAAADGGALPRFRAGQHLPVELQIPGQKGAIKRSYSLSGDPNNCNEYRLTIKREAFGLVSKYLHDEFDVGGHVYASIPSGDFVVPNKNSPLMLISAGVGLTPMVSILHETLAENADRPIWFVHGTRNGDTQALSHEVDQLIHGHQNVAKYIMFSQPKDGDMENRDYDQVGRVSAKAILDLNSAPDTFYMLCGPSQFLSQIKTELEQAGVPMDKILFEAFGS